MNDENRNLEYKRLLSRDERFERSVVAFLNSRDGGTIFVGIEDDGTVCGIANPDLAQRQVADRIRNNIRPATMGLFDIGVEEREEKPVLRIVVSSGPDRPYYLKKFGMTPQGCFVRVGSQTQQIPEAEIESLFARRARTSLRTVPAPNQNLRFEQLRIRYEEHGKNLNDRFKETLELLTPDGRYNLVAYLLADDNNVSIKVAKYAGDDKIELIENEEYGFCTILRACDRVLDKLMVENTTSARIGPKYRQERKRYDPIAVREAVINAFVHNDWIDLDTPVFELFSDRIEITSHGSLLPGMTREDLLSGCSRIRNRELMRVFRDVGLVEQLGSGMRRMLDAYSPDIFRYTETFFHVVFRYPEEPFGSVVKDHPRTLKDGLKTKCKGGPKIPKVVQKQGGPKIIGRHTASANAVEIRIQIAEFLADHSNTTTRGLAMSFGSARSAIIRHLSHLRAAGVVRFVGPARSGHWEVCRENEANLATHPTTQVATQVTTQVTTQVESLLKIMDGEADVATLQEHLGLKERRDFMRRYILPALAVDLIERTIPDKPTSRFQKYRLTAKGRAALAVVENNRAVLLKPSGKATV